MTCSYLTYSHVTINFPRFGLVQLDKICDNDYSLVYFHHGYEKLNKPTWKWLVTCYRSFDRKLVLLSFLFVINCTTFLKAHTESKVFWGRVANFDRSEARQLCFRQSPRSPTCPRTPLSADRGVCGQVFRIDKQSPNLSRQNTSTM